MQGCGNQNPKGFYWTEENMAGTLCKKNTKIKMFSVGLYAKSVLLYGCQTWLVTCEIQRKLQSFVNRCPQYTMNIQWPGVIYNKKLWEMTELCIGRCRSE
jgi:hypothetical protein